MERPVGVSSRILFDIPCKVCNDHSSGKHYGIFACDGCAGFFKRSIRRNRQYVCKAKGENSCIVDKTHRNQCRACRLRKCVQAGMNKDAVQHERGPRNSTMRRHVALYLKEAESAEMAGLSSANHGLHMPTTSSLMSSNEAAMRIPLLTPIISTSMATHARLPSNCSPSLPQMQNSGTTRHPTTPPAFHPMFSLQGHSPMVTSMLSAAQSRSNEVPTPTVSPSSFIGPHHLMTVSSPQSLICQPTPRYPSVASLNNDVDSLCEAAARILFMNVKWAKSVPAFTSLPFSDQLVLLEESWRDLFVLGAAQFMSPQDIAKLISGLKQGCGSSEEGNKRDKSSILDEMRRFQEILVKFKQMNVDPTEYTCLRAIIIFTTDFGSRNKPNKIDGLRLGDCMTKNDGNESEHTGAQERRTRNLSSASSNSSNGAALLDEPELAASLQDQAQLALSKYIQGVYPTQPFRFGKLLLMLPSLHAVPTEAIQQLFFARTIGAIPMDRLLTDMYRSTDF